MKKPLAPGTEPKNEYPEYLAWKISQDKKKREEKWKEFFEKNKKEGS